MEFDVTGQLGPINFAPATAVEEILQNVRTIITTPKFSVPLDRDFGLTMTMLDDPMPAAQAKLTAEIIAAIHRWERRVRVTNVSYVEGVGDAMDGRLIPKVRVRIIGTG